MSRWFREYLWRSLPGGIAALTVAGLLQLGAWNPLERIAYNALFQLRGPIPWDERVAVIEIDEASLKQLGRFPWSRQRYAALLERLAQAEPSVVVFDLIFSEASPEDAQLAAAMQSHGRVVLAQAWDSTGRPLPPVPELEAAAMTTGHILKQEDADGLTRKIDLKLQGIPALGLSTLQAYTLVEEPIQLPPSGSQPLWVNWPGPAHQASHYSFAQVIQGKVPAQVFNNKIVLVGNTATGFDPLPTPFDRNPSTNGVYLTAAVIHNLLQQDSLHVLSSNWLILLLLLGGPGLGIVLSCWGRGQQLAAWVGLCLGWGILSLALFQAGYWPTVALPIALFSLTGVSVALSERLRVSALLQQEINQLWQAYHQDLVIQPQDLPNQMIETNSWTRFRQPASMQRVTQLAALARQLGRSQSAQAAIARSLSLGLLAADLDGHIWFCNVAAASWLQVQVGSHLSLQRISPWLSQEQWLADLQTLQHRGQVASREVQQAGHWLEMQLEPLFYRSIQPQTGINGGQSSLDGFLLVLEDITIRKQVEADLIQQTQELQQASLLKDDFLSTVAHELRTPITNMKMAIHLLKLVGSDDQHNHYLKILQDECARETGLINDLLDLQRLEAAARPLASEKIDLADWLPHIVEPFQERAETQQQTLKIEIVSGLPPLICDPPSLEQVLAELINNACKYTPSGGEILITASSLTPLQIELSVSNSGVTIPETELARIFEKFYRIPHTDSRKQEGTGLGLALVKKLVEYLGGTIQAKNQPEQITFTVQLPASSLAAKTTL